MGGGNQWLGLCVDTGWFGTQGADVPAQIRAAGKFVRHTHIKDVRAAGAHETCLLGDGVADVDGCLAALRDSGYDGWHSWERIVGAAGGHANRRFTGGGAVNADLVRLDQWGALL